MLLYTLIYGTESGTWFNTSVDAEVTGIFLHFSSPKARGLVHALRVLLRSMESDSNLWVTSS